MDLIVELSERFNYDEVENILFIDLSNLQIDNVDQINRIEKELEREMESVDSKVYSIVNYDDCNIRDKVKEEFSDMLKRGQEKYSLATIRYSNKSFTRVALSVAEIKKNLTDKSTVCRSKEEAIREIKKMKDFY